MPAIRRYKSPRIATVHRMSRRAGAKFAILSGRFGLIGPYAKIPHYDHLLRRREISEIVPQMVRYLGEKGCRSVRFFHDSARGDRKILPYLGAMRRACRLALVPLVMVELPSRHLTISQ